MSPKGTRIIIGWDPNEVIVMPLDANSQVMHCQVIFIKENKRLFCSFVYGCNYYIDRRKLWDSLGKHYNLVAGQPWLIAGDFNVTRELVDTMAGHSKISRGMVEFNECINSIEVQDINSNGLHYTWNQRPRGAFGALKKLDRVLGNHKLIEDFPNVFANFQPYRISDHSPMIIKFPIKRKFRVRPFKFVNSLVLLDNFLPIVESVWKTDVEGFGMFRLCQKLKLLKKPLRKLLTSHGNFAEKVSKCREELCRVQESLDLDPCNEELRFEEGIYLQSFLNASREEESYLKQRAKVHWIKEGDSNSAYFHKVVKGKINRNRIETILDGNGNWKEGDEAFKVIVDYFGEFLGVEHGVVPIIRPEDLDFRKLDIQQAVDMIKDVTDEEIKAALFDIDDDKAPGPDGFSSKFFKKAWMIVGSDFCFAVKEFFISKKILKEVNATVIAIWKLISGQNSLWVKWVNCYLLDGRSFWDVGPKDRMSWSWRNLLKIRPFLRDFFYSRIGNGKGTSMWYDNWHQLGPLCYVLSPREITNAGYNIRDKVGDVIVDENWNWPSEWIEMIPQLGDFNVPRIIREKKDEVLWVNYKGKIVPFAVNQVFSSIMCRETIVEWKIALAASIYHIWNERNKRLFGKPSNSVETVVKIITEDIRTKIFSLNLGYLGLDEESRLYEELSEWLAWNWWDLSFDEAWIVNIRKNVNKSGNSNKTFKGYYGQSWNCNKLKELLSTILSFIGIGYNYDTGDWKKLDSDNKNCRCGSFIQGLIGVWFNKEESGTICVVGDNFVLFVRSMILYFSDCWYRERKNKKQRHIGIEGYCGNFKIFWSYCPVRDKCGGENKWKTLKKSVFLRIWIKGYRGQYWGKINMDDPIGNCLGMIEIWRKDTVNGNKKGGFFDKNLNVDNGNGRRDVQQVLDSNKINNKRGQFGNFHINEELWCWNDLKGGWMNLQIGWNKFSGSKNSVHVRLKRQGSVEENKNRKSVNKYNREDDILAFYSNILLRYIKDNKDTRVERRKKIAIMESFGNGKVETMCIFVWRIWDIGVHRTSVAIDTWIRSIYRNGIFEDWKKKWSFHFEIFSLGLPVLVSGLVGILVIGSLAGAGISSSLIEFTLKSIPIVYTIGDRMFWKIGSMFGMNYKDPPDPANKNLYEDDLEADVGAKRRGRRAMHKEFSPYSMIKPLRSKEKMEAKINRLREEKKYLNAKSIADGSKEVLRAGVREIIKSNYGKENIDPQFIKSELEAFDKVIANQKKLEEEKGFVLLQVTSDMVKGYNSSKNLVGGSSPSSPVIQANMGMDAGTVAGSNNRISAGTKNDKGILVDEPKITKDFIFSELMKMGSYASGPGSSSSGPGPVIETNEGKGILGKFPVSQVASVNSGIPVVFNANPIDSISCNTNCNDEDMKDYINENGNLEVGYGNNMKKEQGANFLNMDFSKPVLSPATKLVNEFNKKSYACMVESTNNVVDLNIKVIPKVDGKPSGKVELPYADLMLGGAPYHATLYGFFVGKKLAFPTVNHFSFKMWKMYGLKDIMVNDEGFFFFKFDSKEGMMSVLEGGPWLINNVPMFVQRWRPGLVLSKPQINSVPVWVKVFNVPLEYWNSKGITLIANEIGKPIAMDKITQKMCNEHWGRPAFMRFLVEMSAESEWMKELSVVSIDFGTGEKVESKCRIEYAWRPDICSHCKIYGHKNNNCGILNGKKNNDVTDVAVDREEKERKEKVDDDGFILVTKKNNKGQKFNTGVVINEEGKVDLIKSSEKSTKPVFDGMVVSNNDESLKDEGNQGMEISKKIKEQENQKGGQNEDRSNEGAENRKNGGNFSKFAVGNLKKDGKEKGVFQSKDDKSGRKNGIGVFIPKEKLGTRVKNLIENFNAKKDGMQGKREENQKKVYVPKKQVELKVSSNFDNLGSTSGKIDQDEITTQNPFDVLADLGLRDMSYLDEMDSEILTGGGQEISTEIKLVINDDEYRVLEREGFEFKTKTGRNKKCDKK
ncbi:unnamed protein product [Lactuca saligna]|uniref:DUF4283 domain-containing protein n=1 Tax=Lactuca saligna TaxID=75948 RepID=A0AA35UKF6_LACSI|nr:unnamed protein product [Lactuca saligna]